MTWQVSAPPALPDAAARLPPACRRAHPRHSSTATSPAERPKRAPSSWRATCRQCCRRCLECHCCCPDTRLASDACCTRAAGLHRHAPVTSWRVAQQGGQLEQPGTCGLAWCIAPARAEAAASPAAGHMPHVSASKIYLHVDLNLAHRSIALVQLGLQQALQRPSCSNPAKRRCRALVSPPAVVATDHGLRAAACANVGAGHSGP